jgi:protein-S-isoprenylcysteine O-methyltransferase Ste14
MELIPAFEIGIWNAWLFMLYVILYNIIPYFISLIGPGYREVVKKAAGSDIYTNKTEQKMGQIMFFIFLIPIIYSFFLPIKLFTIWFYIGLFLYLIGVVIGTIAMYSFLVTAADKLVIKGIYQISRNPMYLSMFLIFIGTGIACASWFFLLFTTIFVISTYIIVIKEERFCLTEYGNIYRDYMNKTPRWIGFRRK